jgi:hypothetical protein
VNKTGQEERISQASAEPKVAALIKEYKRCTPWEGNWWNRLGTNDEIRYMQWAGKSSDGKKWDVNLGKQAKPWNGASDTSIPLTDGIITQRVVVAVTAFWRAMAQPKLGTSEESAYAVTLIDYLINECMAAQLFDQVELSAQYQEQFGWYVLHPRWETEISLRRSPVGLEELAALVEQLGQATSVAANAAIPMAGNGGAAGTGNVQASVPGGDAMGGGMGSGVNAALQNPLAGLNGEMFRGLIETPELEEEAVSVMRVLHQIYLSTIEAQVQIEVPPMSEASLRKAVRSLRNEGTAELTVPYVSKNEPEILCLKPWDEVAVPMECTDIQKRPVFRRVFWDETELKRKELTEGLDPEWVEAAWAKRGRCTFWGTGPVTNSTPPTTLSQAQTVAMSGFGMTDSGSDLVEVIYATYWALDEDHVPGVFCTVFHAEIADMAGSHELLDLGKMPYVAGRRECLGPQITASRGVPEVAGGWQREKKSQRDAVIDLTSIAVIPPMNVYANSMKVKYRFGPAVENTVIRGQEPKLMEIPTNGAPLSVEVTKQIDHDAAYYFGLMTPDIEPTLQQLMQQHLANRTLLTWTEAFLMVLELCRIHMPDAEFAKITGAPAGWLDSKRNSEGLFYTSLHFDVREMNPEYVMKLMEMINQTVLPGDTTGAIDRRKLTFLQLRAINPRLARELVMDQTAASQKLYDDTASQIALMFLGNMPKLVENDPTAATKIEFSKQIVQGNPNYIQALQQGGRFAELMQMYAKNLEFSLTQEKNKQVGRIGVDPEAAAQEPGIGGAAGQRAYAA